MCNGARIGTYDGICYNGSNLSYVNHGPSHRGHGGVLRSDGSYYVEENTSRSHYSQSYMSPTKSGAVCDLEWYRHAMQHLCRTAAATAVNQANSFKSVSLLFTITVLYIVYWTPRWLHYAGLYVPVKI